MSAYVVLTAILIQRGSSASKDPDSPPRDTHLAAQAMKPGAPAILRNGPIARALYARSLGTVLFILFILSFVMHWTQSAQAAAEEARTHGEATFSTMRSEEHTSELQSLMRISYAVFCLKKKKHK